MVWPQFAVARFGWAFQIFSPESQGSRLPIWHDVSLVPTSVFAVERFKQGAQIWQMTDHATAKCVRIGGNLGCKNDTAY